MKYTRQDVVNGKKVWRFICPRDVAAAGVAKSQTFDDGRLARFEIPKLVRLVELYRSGDIKEGTVGTHSLMVHLLNHYIHTDYYRQLAGSTQKQYESVLGLCLGTPIHSKTFGDCKVTDVNAKMCRDLYNKWVTDGSVSLANTKARILSVVLNYAVSIELLVNNPMAKVRKLRHEPTTRIWTQGEVERLLEVGYSSFDLRNITLLAHMCYEYAQRPIDISRLTWGQLDFDTNCLTIRQTKRGATVQLPIEEPLRSMLIEQQEAWDFQEYVVPHQIPRGSRYHVMNRSEMNSKFTALKVTARLATDLQLGLLRKTAIVELVEAGVDAVGIMNVSGHKSINSLNPYMKHTLKGAATALSQRRKT
jgi:integrase